MSLWPLGSTGRADVACAGSDVTGSPMMLHHGDRAHTELVPPFPVLTYRVLVKLKLPPWREGVMGIGGKIPRVYAVDTWR